MSSHGESRREGALARTRPVRLFFSCLATWLVPFCFFTLFVYVTPLPAPFTDLPLLDPLVTLYVVCCGLIAAAWITRRYLGLYALDRGGASAVQVRAGVRRVIASLPWMVLAYLVVGTVLGLFQATASTPIGLDDFGVGDALVVGFGVLAVLLFILLPLGLVCLDEFGLVFGHTVGGRPLVPLTLRALPGLFLVLMVGATVLIQEYLTAGTLEIARIAVIAVIVPYAALVTMVTMRYTTSALGSLHAFVAHDRAGDPVDVADLQPGSLDAIGVMVRNVRMLISDQQASEARIRAFTAVASDLLFELDADERVTWISGDAQPVVGISSDEVIGREVASIITALSMASPEDLLAVLEDRLPLRDHLLELRGAANEARFLRLNAAPFHGADGRFAGYRGVLQNVTDGVTAQRKLEEAESCLAEAQKMEALGQLTGGVAHDFNNLLLIVAANAELAQIEMNPVVRRQQLDAVVAAGERGGRLVLHLLSFARRQVLQPRPLNLLEHREELEALLGASLSEHAHLEVDLADDLAHPLVDVAQLESALLNLVLNARDAMPDGGRVVVRARNRSLSAGEFELPAGEYIEIRVQDTGEGMPERVRERVFEPFFSTRSDRSGTGLGLSMVYGFVSQSQGAVRIESEVGRGTTIIMLLPVGEQAAPRSSTAEMRAVPREGVGLLLVEDEPDVRVALTRGLESAGFRVVAAADADEAMAVWRAVDGIEFVLSDIVLRGSRSGSQLLADLRREAPALKCLLMTGYADSELDAAPEEIAEVEVITKPFPMKALVARIHAQLAEAPAGSAVDAS